jgi:hypothetical protein
MPTCTPIYGLSYPICSDPPCDVAGTFCEFTNQVETQLDRLDGVVDRTSDTIPQFQVSISAPYTLTGTSIVIAFDTVLVDTDNMVDLTTDPFSFPINTPGRWFLYFNASANGNITIQENWTIGISNTPITGAPNIPAQNYEDNGTINPSFLDGSGIQRYPSAGQRVRMFANPATRIVLTATFGGYWIGDI